MREILFKAKRIDNGEWVEGFISYPHSTDTEKGVESYYFMAADERGWYGQCVVSANTICQFTGLTDKNGQKIWENDCIGHRLNVVEFLDGYWCVNGDRPLWMVAKDWEVIGNIFDNPELLKGGWIPCSERLPEEPEENPDIDYKPLEIYLVCVPGDKYPFRAFWNGKFFTDGLNKVDAVAWMPLPSPYHPEK